MKSSLYLKLLLVLVFHLKFIFGFSQQLYEIDTLRNSEMATSKLANFSTRFENYLHEADSSYYNKVRVRKVFAELRFNTNRPFGNADGIFSQVKGAQTQTAFQLTFFSKKFGFLLTPSLNYVNAIGLDRSFIWGNKISFKHLHASLEGSSFFFKIKKLQFGVSNSRFNLGPTQIEHLLMSDNAPGFKHLYIRNYKPIKIGIGTLYFDFTAGSLQPAFSSYPYENRNLSTLPSNMSTSKGLNRYFNSLYICFAPRFLPNNYFGLIRQYQIRTDKMKNETNAILRYLPVLQAVVKKSATNSEDSLNRDQQLSFFYALRLPSVKSQLSFEYGWNDHKWNFRDLFVSWPHSAAYIISFKKIGRLKNFNSDFVAEYTRMKQHLELSIRNAGDWYEFHGGSVGPTHRGQILGVGGSNGLGANKLYLLYRLTTSRFIYGFRYTSIVNDHSYQRGKPPIWRDQVFSMSTIYKRRNISFRSEIAVVSSSGYGFTKTSTVSSQINIGFAYSNVK